MVSSKKGRRGLLRGGLFLVFVGLAFSYVCIDAMLFKWGDISVFEQVLIIVIFILAVCCISLSFMYLTHSNDPDLEIYENGIVIPVCKIRYAIRSSYQKKKLFISYGKIKKIYKNKHWLNNEIYEIYIQTKSDIYKVSASLDIDAHELLKKLKKYYQKSLEKPKI